MISKIVDFFKTELWRMQSSDMPKFKAIALRQIKILVLSFRGLKEDKVSMQASALTFYSLLSVVPVVAMVFGIAKGFGFENYVKQQLIISLGDKQEVLDWVLKFANSFLDNTKGGFIAGIGLVILFWSVMKVFGNIELSFNAIWQIRRPRVWFRKFSDYLSMILIAPILIILSSSATVFITTSVTQITQKVELLGMVSPFIFFLVKLIPYVLIWLLLTVIYVVMPNTKVNFKSALVGGIIAGTIFVIVQWLYIHFQIGVSRYNAIYGSFAVFPLFIVWMQISWLIVLFGAEISYSNQNVEKYEFEYDIINISNYNYRIVTLLLMSLIVKNFSDNGIPLSASQISKKLGIPLRLVRKIIYELLECRILSEININNSKMKQYQPALDIHNITISYILTALDHNGSDFVYAADSKEQEKIKIIFDNFYQKIENENGSTLLLNL